MLKIRAEQIRPFEQDAEAAFVRRVMNYLRAHHADEQVRFRGAACAVAELPDEILETLVENGIARGRSHGLTWKSSLISFVVLMFAVAPNFDRHRYAASVLADENIPADRRLEIITEQMSDEDWETIAAGYDEWAWEAVAAVPPLTTTTKAAATAAGATTTGEGENK